MLVGRGWGFTSVLFCRLKTPTVALMMILLMVATVILKWIVLNPLQDFPLHSKRPSAQQKKENSIKLEFHSYQGGTKPLHIHASSNGKIRIRTPEAKQLIHEGQGRVPEKAGVDITIVGFTNISMLNFALNWLWHLEKTIGKRQVSDRLLLYVVGDNTKAALLKSGLIPEHCIRCSLLLPFFVPLQGGIASLACFLLESGTNEKW